jgi:prepilin-type N-terminal cleavage/methylation domain-containing protein
MTHGGVSMRKPGEKGFSLIEVLVVAAIIALVVLLSIEPVLRVREMARRTHCITNLRQIFIGMEMYAEDYNGWGIPGVSWGSPQTFFHYGKWIDRYFPNPDLFRCPATDWSAYKGFSWNYRPGIRTYSYVYNGTLYPGRQHCSYWLLFAQSDYPLLHDIDPVTYPPWYDYSNFYGWHMYYNSVAAGQYKGPCPNMKWLDTFGNRMRPAYYDQYILPGEKQAAAIDCHGDNGFWYGYGLSNGVRNNHTNRAGLHVIDDGENVIYMDGHVEWKPAGKGDYYFWYYYGKIWW